GRPPLDCLSREFHRLTAEPVDLLLLLRGRHVRVTLDDRPLGPELREPVGHPLKVPELREQLLTARVGQVRLDLVEPLLALEVVDRTPDHARFLETAVEPLNGFRTEPGLPGHKAAHARDILGPGRADLVDRALRI